MSNALIKFGGYQGPASVHTRAGHVFGNALAASGATDVAFEFDSNIVERGHKAADLLSMVEEGTLTGCYFSSSYLASRVPELGIFDQHFVVPDRTAAYRLLDGALGHHLAELVAANTGYTVLGFWDNGFRHISNAGQPLLTPDDCAGLTIRTLANDNHQRVFRALGFDPKSIDVRDLPAAVEDGTVQAQENPLTNIYNFGLHATHRHITLTRHLMGVALMLFNTDAVNSWSPAQRAHVEAAVATATAAQRRFADEDDEICAERLRADGVSLHELTADNRALFRAATQKDVALTRSQFSADLVKLFDDSLR